MKRITSFIASAAYFANTSFAYAEDSLNVNIQANAPKYGVSVNKSIGQVLGNVLTIVYIVAALAVLFMLILGAFQWITSGGDKEAVAKARGRITQALVGLVILALAFFIVVVVGKIVNIDILNLQNLPTLNQ